MDLSPAARCANLVGLPRRPTLTRFLDFWLAHVAWPRPRGSAVAGVGVLRIARRDHAAHVALAQKPREPWRFHGEAPQVASRGSC